MKLKVTVREKDKIGCTGWIVQTYCKIAAIILRIYRLASNPGQGAENLEN
jgi:hypothetical protein